jgi:hypothetical protein
MNEIIDMWKAERPVEGKPAKGFSILDDVRQVTVYRATRKTGAYSHHCRLIYHLGRLYGMWSNHPRGEGAPGMRVLYSVSDNAESWSKWQELFPRPGLVGDFKALGLAASPGRWLTFNGQLYATCSLFSTIGFSQRGVVRPSDVSPIRDGDHPAKVREVYAFVAREVNPDGSLGPIFALWDNLPRDIAFKVQEPSERDQEELLSLLKDLVSKPDDLPSYARLEKEHVLSFCRRMPSCSPGELRYRMHYPNAADGHRLSEPTTFPTEDGRHVLLARDPLASHRMYVSFSRDGGLHWDPARATNIPDSPSRTTSVVLDDGTVLLIGNQVAPRFEDADRRHYDRDPLTVAVSEDGLEFTSVYALRHGAPEMRVKGVGGRTRGFQYPGALVRSGTLHVLYSVGKEDIESLSVPISDILGSA